MKTKTGTLHDISGVIRLIKPYRAYVALVIICSALSVVSQLFIPILTGRAIDAMIEAGKVDIGIIADTVTLILFASAAGALGQWLLGLFNNKIAFGVSRDLRDKSARKLQRLPLSYLDSHASGDIVSRVISDAEQLSDGILLGFTQLFTGILTIIGTLVFMFIQNAEIAAVVVCVTPLSLIAAFIISSRSYKYFREQNIARGEQTAFINERTDGVKTVKAFGYEDESLAEFDKTNEKLKRASLKAVFSSSLTNPITRFVNGTVYAGVALFGALSVVDGGITVGVLSCFLAYANQYTKPFNEISGVITEMQNALSCAGRLFEFLDAKELEPDGKDAVILDRENTDGRVEFDDVSFSYVPEKKLIHDFSLKVESGKHVAIVGPTGCGKTTLINLIMRFYDVNNGEIRVSGHDVKDVTRLSLCRSFGMVLQETWLMTGTVAENIAYGKPQATREDIINAAKAARADSFIERLPLGYDTVIGQGEGQLSQGQKQLLCIARVMLCKPPMLILDEATSSIDTRTEMMISKAFSSMMDGKTSFIVAHRLSTVREADIILVMKDGSIVESGTHEKLLEKGGFYKSLWQSQFAGNAI